MDPDKTKKIIKRYDSYEQFISKCNKRATKIKELLYSDGIEYVLSDFYNEINYLYTLPDKVTVTTKICDDYILRQVDTPQVKTFCGDVANMLQQNGFQYNDDIHGSKIVDSRNIKCTFVKQINTLLITNNLKPTSDANAQDSK